MKGKFEMNIGVIGLGYVGSAMVGGMENHFNVLSYDKFKESTNSSIKELIENVEIVFVCVPTPMKKDGSCDTSIVESVLSEIHKCNKSSLTTVLKSTLEIGSTESFEKKYNNLNLVFNPEFLTEANFLEDFKNQKFIIIGSSSQNDTSKIQDLYSKAFPKAEILVSNHKEAELSKYFINCFLALKVSYANEISSLCQKLDINYDEVLRLISLEKRVGKSHLAVPGPDGKKGYGGSCFPKDINSLITLFENNSIESHVLSGSWKRNSTIDRPEKDWEKLKGRAVSEQD